MCSAPPRCLLVPEAAPSTWAVSTSWSRLESRRCSTVAAAIYVLTGVCRCAAVSGPDQRTSTGALSAGQIAPLAAARLTWVPCDAREGDVPLRVRLSHWSLSRLQHAQRALCCLELSLSLVCEPTAIGDGQI